MNYSALLDRVTRALDGRATNCFEGTGVEIRRTFQAKEPNKLPYLAITSAQWQEDPVAPSGHGLVVLPVKLALYLPLSPDAEGPNQKLCERLDGFFVDAVADLSARASGFTAHSFEAVAGGVFAETDKRRLRYEVAANLYGAGIDEPVVEE